MAEHDDSITESPAATLEEGNHRVGPSAVVESPRPILQRLLSNWGSLAGMIIAWEAIGRFAGLRWLPPFTEVVGELWGLFADGTIQEHLLASLSSLAIGFSLALGVGLAIGTMMGMFRLVDAALDIYVNIMFFTPALMFAPILFAIFGLSIATRIGVVFLYSVFIIIINTATAIRTVDPDLGQMARSFSASNSQVARKVLFPASMPLVIAGVRLGVGRAVKGMINGELLIALVGIGGLAAKFGRQLAIPKVWAISLFILILALVLDQTVSMFERRVTSWLE